MDEPKIRVLNQNILFVRISFTNIAISGQSMCAITKVQKTVKKAMNIYYVVVSFSIQHMWL